jgi:hypothetical protein
MQRIDPYSDRLNDDDRYVLRRYQDFRAAADYVTAALTGVPAVKRVALIGSVALSPTVELTGRRRGRIHEPKDLDLAVWVDSGADLNRLRVEASRAVNHLWDDKRIGVAHHQVDIFLLDGANRYLGRLCRFNQCPKDKPECRVPGCGDVPFLRQHEEFVFHSGTALAATRMQVLYQRLPD